MAEERQSKAPSSSSERSPRGRGGGEGKENSCSGNSIGGGVGKNSSSSHSNSRSSHSGSSKEQDKKQPQPQLQLQSKLCTTGSKRSTHCSWPELGAIWVTLTSSRSAVGAVSVGLLHVSLAVPETAPRTVVPSAAGAALMTLCFGRFFARFVAADSLWKMADFVKGHRPSLPSQLFRPVARPSVHCSRVMHAHPLSVAVLSRASRWNTARSVPSDTV
jgi:hypothetical protein